MDKRGTELQMISLAQIKAARALLGWSQDALARAAGLSLPAINNIERGLVSPRKDTLSAIEKALNNAGVDFIDISGVQLRQPDVSTEIIEGADWLETYDKDILSVLRSPEDEIIQWSCNERSWVVYGGTTNHLYIERRDLVGFKERIIVPDTIDYITNKPSLYRALPKSCFDDVSYQVYGDRIAHILWQARKIVIIKSDALAAAKKAQFNHLWETAAPFTKAQINKLAKWTR